MIAAPRRRRVISESGIFVLPNSVEIDADYFRERSMSAASASFPLSRLRNRACQKNSSSSSFSSDSEEYEATESEMDMFGEETITYDNKEELQPNGNNAFSCFRVLYCFLFLLLLLACEKLWFSLPDADAPKRSMVISSFKKKLYALEDKFPSQPNQSWRIFASAMTPILNGRKTEPSVILVLHDKAAHQTAVCLVWHLANLVNNEIQTIKNVRSAVASVNCSEHPYIVPEKGVIALHNRINSELGEAHSNVLVLNEIERLPADAYRTLHTFSDSTTAPYKEVIIFLTLSCPSDTVLPLDEDLLKERCLYDSWLRRKLQKERFAALLSRIAGSMVVVVSEADLLDELHCSLNK
ncbi:hypothetical protein D918_06221 [Trichuris suis]|nr:hypothetical protein D918_06221 [Trichuris suis]